MPHWLRCHGCGKHITLAQQDSGKLVMCPACGAGNQAPQLTPVYAAESIDDARRPLAEAPPIQPPPALLMPPPALVAPAPPGQAPSAAPASPATRVVPALAQAQPRHAGDDPPRWVWTLLACLCAAGISVFATAYIYTQKQHNWELENRDKLLALNMEAASAAREGRHAEALAKYRELNELVQDRQIKDAFLAEQLAAARSEQQRIYELLIQGTRTPPARESPAPVPIIAPPPATQPAPPRVAIVVPKPDPPKPDPQPVKPRDPVVVPGPATQPVVNRIEPTPKPPARVDPPNPRLAMFRPRPPIRTFEVISEDITDEQIGAAIRRGADLLLKQFGDAACLPGGGRSGTNEQYPGINALCVYALMQCGQALNDEKLSVRSPRIKSMLNVMRDMPTGETYETYIRGIRATALAVCNRAEDRAALREDVNWLINNSRHGAYSYTGRSTKVGSWDNSNSQYGLLGVWSGAEVGCEVPPTYWLQVQNHWFECQCAAGDWGYSRAGRSGTLSMTVAGLASLFVTHDYLDAPLLGTAVGRDPFSKPLARGLAWLESRDNCIEGAYGGYTLYGIERVGLASGFKYFGDHDWYRELAAHLLRTQRPEGSWGGGRGIGPASRGDLTETAYCLLFLARGRHPVLMNKLRFDGCWANRPRDVSNLARFASKELERPLNWQVVPLRRDWMDWMDSPVLYLASHEAVQLTDRDIENLRRFVEAGGLIFTQADGGSESFNTFVVELGRRLFPQYEFADLPPDHELFWLHYRIENRPKLRYIGNGSRILLLHSPQDITSAWQARAEKTRRNVFELGVNMFVYAAGKTDLRNRLVSTYLPPPRLRRVDYRIMLTRVRYPGAWDPEPAAFDRFSRWFEYRTGYALDVAGADLAALRLENGAIAHLTGTAAYAPTAQQIESIRKFVESGGILVIDACGGSPSFNQCVAGVILPRAFPNAQLETIPLDHPLYAARRDGMDFLARPAVRTIAEQKMGRTAGLLRMLKAGHGYVIYSPLDMTSSLLGTHTWGVMGYQPAYAQNLLKNILLWVADGCRETSDGVATAR